MLNELIEQDVQPDSIGRKSPNTNGPLPPELLRKIDAYCRAANYLSVGQIYF